MILLCFYHNMTFDTKVSHLVHILGGRSSKLLFLSVLSCQLLGLVRLLGLRSGTKLSTGGGLWLVFIYGLPPLQSSLGVAVLNRVSPQGPEMSDIHLTSLAQV